MHLKQEVAALLLVSIITCKFVIASTGISLLDGVVKEAKASRDDIDKGCLFLEEADNINNNIKAMDLEKTVSEKVLKQIENAEENKSVFHINNIDKMSLSELKRISDGIHGYLNITSFEKQSEEYENVKQLKE